MKDKMIMWMVGTILSRIDEEDVKIWLRAGIKLLRDKVASTPNPYDDMVVLPILDVIEKVIGE